MSSPPSSPTTPADAAGSEPADRVAAAVLAVAGVDGLHGGAHGEVATYLPGRRVVGVRLRDPGCAVHVVLAWGVPIAGTAELVRRAVNGLVAGPVDVTIEDVSPPTVPAGPAS
ncbi:hypothetical protein FE634_01610 [Nocardioides dongxiaopingii]|uniref:hypothetical protein n=1 Tax=Nocardioides TaxID=1839 RepID=UPI0010C76B91|nr:MULTISPECIES: hypothetical protein [Nocardioides]QCW49434.1 hypothetical protein FE634_01610 [Nocardioides sp. S-1144]